MIDRNAKWRHYYEVVDVGKLFAWGSAQNAASTLNELPRVQRRCEDVSGLGPRHVDAFVKASNGDQGLDFPIPKLVKNVSSF